MKRNKSTQTCPECGPTNDVRMDPTTLFEFCDTCGSAVDSTAPPILGTYDPGRTANARNGYRNTSPLSPWSVKPSQRRWARMDSHSQREAMHLTVAKEISRTPFSPYVRAAMEGLLREILRCITVNSFSRIRADSSARKGGVMEEESSIGTADRKARRSIRANEQAWAIAMLIDSYRPINALEEIRKRGMDEDVIECLAKKMQSILRAGGVSLKERIYTSLRSDSNPTEVEMERWEVLLNNSGLGWTETRSILRNARVALSQMPHDRTSRQSPRQLVEISCLIALVEMDYSELAKTISDSSRTRGIKTTRSCILGRKFTPWPVWPVSLTSETEENSSGPNWGVM